VATWTVACPLESTCSECGLDFAWAQVIGTRYAPPGWCVEFAPTGWSLPWRSVRTMAVSISPWGFWQSLRMSHEVRWGRLAGHVVLLVLPFYLLQAACNGLAAWIIWQDAVFFGAGPLPSPARVVAQSALLPWSERSPGSITYPAGTVGSRPFVTPFPPPARQLDAGWGGLFDRVMLPLLLGTTLLCPAGFLALPVSRRRAKVRAAHIHRVTLYSLTLLLLPVGALVIGPLYVRLMGRFGAPDPMPGPVVMAVYSLPLLLVVWWSCATGRYLRMRHAWGVGLAVVIIAVLITVLAAIIIYLLVS
jgi:hypothetical protein